MFLSYQNYIPDILNALRDEVTLTIIRMAEDPRNEPLCERFRDIRDNELTQACILAHRGTEESLIRGVEAAEEGLIKLFDLYLELNGRDREGNELPERTLIYPSPVYEGGAGEFELRQENGVETRIPPSIPFKEKALIFATMEHLMLNVCNEMRSQGADMSAFEEVYRTRWPDTNFDEEEVEYVSRLRAAISYLSTRLEPNTIDEQVYKDHVNYPVASKLRKLDYRLQFATGGSFGAQVNEVVGADGESHTPLPLTSEEIAGRYDAIFTELHTLLHGPEIDGIVPLRNTRQCKMSTQGSIRIAKEKLRMAVADLESSGMEFPEYHAAADRGRGRD